MKMKWITVSLMMVWFVVLQTDAGDYETRRGNAILVAHTSTKAKGVLQIQVELKPRNFTRIDRVKLVSPSHKELKPSEKTTFAEQTVEGAQGKKEQVELGTERTSGTYMANSYLFELPTNEKPNGRWFFYALGAGARGQDSGYRVEIPAKDIEAALKGEPVP